MLDEPTLEFAEASYPCRFGGDSNKTSPLRLVPHDETHFVFQSNHRQVHRSMGQVEAETSVVAMNFTVFKMLRPRV